MQLKNVTARAYGIMGKIYAPLQTFELTDEVAIASIQPAIDAGDMVIVESDIFAKAPDNEVTESELESMPIRRGRPAKTKEAE